MSSGATTCYKVKTCSEGGYYTSSQSGMHCSAVGYNGYTCYDCHTPDFYYPSGYSYSYSSCKNGQSSHTPTCGHSGCSITGTTKYTAGTSKTCSDGGYYSSQPSCRKNCSTTSYCGNSCYTSTCGTQKTAADEGLSTSVPSCRKNCSQSTSTCGNKYYTSTCGTAKTCSDEGYRSSIPSGKTCTQFTTPCGNSCYRNCKDDTPAKDFYVHVSGGGSGITGTGTLGAFIDKGGPFASVNVYICFTCNVGCLSGTATTTQKSDNLGRYTGCYYNVPEYDGNTCYISGVGLLDTVYEGDTFTVSGKKYKLICK